MDDLYSRTVAPTKSQPFQVHGNLPVTSCIFSITSFTAWCFSFNVVECPNAMDACSLVLRTITHFKLRLGLSIKSRQSLALYYPKPRRRRRTCSGPLQYTTSVVCLKNDENSASRFLSYVTSAPDSNTFFSFKRDASTLRTPWTSLSPLPDSLTQLG